MYSICEFSDFYSHLQLTSGQMTSLLGHFRSADVMRFLVALLPRTASYSLVGIEIYNIREFSTFHSHFKVTSGQIMSLPGHFRLPEVT